MRKKILSLLLATVGLCFSDGLPVVTTKIGTDINFGPVAKGSGYAYLGATNKDSKNPDHALTNVEIKRDGTGVTITPFAPALKAADKTAIDNSISNKVINNLVLCGNDPILTVGDEKIYKVSGANKEVVTINKVALKDSAPTDVDKPISAIAANGSYVFAAVPGAGKAWSAVDGNNRGIAILNPNDLTQYEPTDFEKAVKDAAPAALKNDHAVNAATAAFSATKPLAIKWDDTTGIAGAELTEDVNMYWNDNVNRLYVGLSGVKRDDKEKEGGVCSMLVGRIDKTEKTETAAAKTSFVLSPIVKDMAAPRLDVEMAAKKVAIANAACVVAEAIATVSDANKTTTATFASGYTISTQQPQVTILRKIYDAINKIKTENDLITWVDAIYAANSVGAAYDAAAADKAAKPRAAAQIYVDNIAYSEMALAAKKSYEIAGYPADANHSIVAATAATALLDFDAIANKCGLGANNDKTDEYDTAIKAMKTYKTTPTAANAKNYITKVIAYDAAISKIAGIDVYVDTDGYSSADPSTMSAAKASAKNIGAKETDKVPSSYFDTVGAAAPLLKPLGKSLKNIVAAAAGVADAATVADTNKLLQAAALPYTNQKVSANDSTRMVANYFAGAGYPKAQTLDANDDATGKARVVNPFGNNGNDDIALTAGKMASLRTTPRGHNYLITNVITKVGSVDKNLICALPLMGGSVEADKGTISKVANGVATFDAPALNMSELPIFDDVAVVVGGNNDLIDVALGTDIFTDGDDSVYMALGGNTPLKAGLVKSTALFDKNGIINGWTQWRHVDNSLQRIKAAVFDPFTNKYMFLKSADYVSDFNTIELTGGGNLALTPEDLMAIPPTALKAVMHNAFPVSDNGIFNLFAYDKNTPGFANNTLAAMVAVGYDTLSFVVMADQTQGTLRSADEFNINNVFTFADQALKDIAPIVCTAIAEANGQAWLFAAGYNGLTVLSAADGKGFSSFDGTNSQIGGLTFKQLTDNRFKNIRKITSGKNNNLLVMTDTAIYSIALGADKFRAANPVPLVATEYMPAKLDTVGYLSDMVVLGTDLILLAATGKIGEEDTESPGLWLASKSGGTLNPTPISTKEDGPAVQINYKSKTETTGDLYVLFANFTKDDAKLNHYDVDMSKVGAARVAASTINTVTQFTKFYLNFDVGDGVVVVNSPTEHLVTKVPLKNVNQRAEMFVDKNVTNVGAPIFDDVSGCFIAPYNGGVVVI